MAVPPGAERDGASGVRIVLRDVPMGSAELSWNRGDTTGRWRRSDWP